MVIGYISVFLTEKKTGAYFSSEKLLMIWFPSVRRGILYFNQHTTLIWTVHA